MAVEKKVLIVDDEQDAVDIVEAMLSEIEGITTISAGDGAAGLQKARNEAPDMIILDVQMPVLDGFQVFADLGRDESTKEIPVAMLTGVAEKTGLRFSSDQMKEYFGREPMAYIEKPVDPGTLQKIVSKALGIA